MNKVNCGIGNVKTSLSSADHNQWNCGIGLYDPNRVFFQEDSNGYVNIDGTRSIILRSKPKTRPGYEMIGDKEYRVVEINGLIWMAENLDYKWDGLHIGTDQLEVNKGWDPSHSWLPEPGACYRDNDEATWGYNGRKVGLYYNETARRQLDSGIIPGWRLATSLEANELYEDYLEYDVRPIVAKEVSWYPDYPDLSEVADSTGFTLLPSSIYGYDGELKDWGCIGSLCYGGNGGEESPYINVVYFPYDADDTGSIDFDSWANDACPVRLVKDV